jgi:hypothetical protein
MTDDIKRNFLGIPIEGTIQAGSTRVDQLPREDFENIVSRVLNNEFFTEFGWEQFTPYFNDGEPCEFGASGLWIKTQNDPHAIAGWSARQAAEGYGTTEVDWDAEDDMWGVDWSDHPTLGEMDNVNGKQVYVGHHEAEYNLARELNKAIEGGQFENVLLDLFGDHCQVKVSRTGITIDEYSHD